MIYGRIAYIFMTSDSALTHLECREIAQRLWLVNDSHGDSGTPLVARSVFSNQEIARLPRPWELPGREFAITFANGPVLTRMADLQKANKAYSEMPRTKLFESVHTRKGEWQAVVSATLAVWLGKTILSSVYESRGDDKTLPIHSDAWHNIVLQLRGSKKWRFEEEVLTLRQGDVLIVPTGVEHFVKTDGYSIHINFEAVEPQVVEEYMATSTELP